jgi:phosphatidylserine/phosphatidylglycerophosphate/cardiolipin synthase-like enzyme
MIAAILCSSCAPESGAGTYHTVIEDPSPVSLAGLARYYRQQTGDLVKRSATTRLKSSRFLTFTADPFDHRRILAPSYCTWEEVQDLFFLDEDRFVERSGEPDFLTAALAEYRRMPFDNRKQALVRPYRALAAWGGLFHPPVKILSHPLAFYDREFAPDSTLPEDDSPYFDPAFQQELDTLTQTELTYGNSLRALFNGVESYPEKLRMIGEAKRFLYVAVMTIVADSTGRELIKLMVNRKRAGVDVRLIVDDFYTFSISSFAVGVLEHEGIPVARVADKRLNQLDRMFHNKFWIRDGEEAILGGMNILDYENMGTGFNFDNRDTDVLVRGPAVTDLLGSFVRIWKRYDREGRSIRLGDSTVAARRSAEGAAGVRGSEHYAQWLGERSTRMNGICRTAVQGDNAEPQRIATLLTRYAERARHSIFMTTPGIECTVSPRPSCAIDTLGSVLVGKCSQPSFRGTFITNGIDGGWGESTIFLRTRMMDSKLLGDPMWVDIMTPLIDGGGRDVAQSLHVTARPFLEGGWRVYQYFNYIHAKEFCFDRTLVGIGSWNFDNYSAQNNHECAIFCLDKRLRDQLERQLVLDMVNSVPLIAR